MPLGLVNSGELKPLAAFTATTVAMISMQQRVSLLNSNNGGSGVGSKHCHDDDEEKTFDLEGNSRVFEARTPSSRLIRCRWQSFSAIFAGGLLLVVGLCVVFSFDVAAGTPPLQKFLQNIVILLTSDFVIDFLAAGASYAVAKTITAPIERVKLLIQTQDANPRVLRGEVTPYAGVVDCVVRVAREQGVGAFWWGNVANVILPTQAFNFAFKDKIKSVLPKADHETDFGKFFAVNVAAGGLAGAASLCIVYPLDYARTRLTADVGSGKSQYAGLWDCLKTTFEMRGVGGLYNGIGVSICGIIPYRGVYFGLFDTLSGINPYQHAPNGVLRDASKFVCAQTAAVVGAYAAYPFDTVRRRLQMQSDLPREEWAYAGAGDCFRTIVRDEGATALFKGAFVNVFRTIGAALVLVMYSEITAALIGEG